MTRRILLVEDHADTAEVFARLLAVRGFRVTIADSIASALDHARRFPVDLLLCDIQLPDGNGCELLRKLRDELGMDLLRAIAFSGHDKADFVEQVKGAGFEAFMLKPIECAELFSVIEEVSHAHPPAHVGAREFIAILNRPT
jgi:two-component system CheB/CheR fusion protein